MKSDIVRIAAELLSATTTTLPFVFDSTEYHDSTKCNNIPVTYPINNRHERRKQKAMKRNKK
jgi:transposase